MDNLTKTLNSLMETACDKYEEAKSCAQAAWMAWLDCGVALNEAEFTCPAGQWEEYAGRKFPYPPRTRRFLMRFAAMEPNLESSGFDFQDATWRRIDEAMKSMNAPTKTNIDNHQGSGSAPPLESQVPVNTQSPVEKSCQTPSNGHPAPALPPLDAPIPAHAGAIRDEVAVVLSALSKARVLVKAWQGRPGHCYSAQALEIAITEVYRAIRLNAPCCACTTCKDGVGRANCHQCKGRGWMTVSEANTRTNPVEASV